MKKFISLFLVFISMFCLSSTVFADNGDIKGDSGITVQPQEEIAFAEEKMAAALEVSDLILNGNKTRISEKMIQEKVEEYIKKYAPESSYRYTANNNSRSVAASYCLWYDCYRQPNSYYCGPTSAYILLRGMGRTGFSIENLATDLGTTTQGTPFPGTWVSTLNNRSGGGPRFVTSWNPGSQYKNYAYTAIGVGQHGFVNDIHMTSNSYTLPGYNASGEYWHYIAADCIDLDTNAIRYLDSSDAQTGRYGDHWVQINVMQSLVSDRGIIF